MVSMLTYAMHTHTHHPPITSLCQMKPEGYKLCIRFCFLQSQRMLVTVIPVLVHQIQIKHIY